LKRIAFVLICLFFAFFAGHADAKKWWKDPNRDGKYPVYPKPGDEDYRNLTVAKEQTSAGALKLSSGTHKRLPFLYFSVTYANDGERKKALLGKLTVRIFSLKGISDQDIGGIWLIPDLDGNGIIGSGEIERAVPGKREEWKSGSGVIAFKFTDCARFEDVGAKFFFLAADFKDLEEDDGFFLDHSQFDSKAVLDDGGKLDIFGYLSTRIRVGN